MKMCPSRNQRAQGRPGAQCTRSLVCKVESTRVRNHGFAETSGLPCAMVLRLISRSPRGPGSFAPVALADRLRKNLTPTSGRQDHTTSPSASSVARLAPPLRPPHPNPASVTFSSRPSEGWDSDRFTSDLGKNKTRIFWRRGLDREFVKHLVGQISRPVSRQLAATIVLSALSRDPYPVASRLEMTGRRLSHHITPLWLWVPAQGRDDIECAATKRAAFPFPSKSRRPSASLRQPLCPRT
jgi:hypothetical protein